MSVFVSLVMMAKEKPPITVVGDVGGRIAIIVVRVTTPPLLPAQLLESELYTLNRAVIEEEFGHDPLQSCYFRLCI